MLTVHQLKSLASPRWQIELRNPLCARTTPGCGASQPCTAGSLLKHSTLEIRCVSIRTIVHSVPGFYVYRRVTSARAGAPAPHAAFVAEHTAEMNISCSVSRAFKRSV